MKKIFLAAILGFVLFPSVSVLAADQYKIAPAFNTVCWRKEDCTAVRKSTFGLEDSMAANGWLEKEAPCDEAGWGKCLPAGQTKTSISFGGKSQFSDIGDYITTVYNYVLSIASILAVIMIVVAGVQWATSGGSSEAIGSAKKRITGALIGLLIAFLSYAILNTLNPNLVNLRLPQVYLVRPLAVAFDYCSSMPTSTLFADVVDQSAKNLKPLYSALADNAFYYMKTVPDNRPAGLVRKNPSEFSCNKQFFVKDAGGATCWGHFCQNNLGCIRNNDVLKQTADARLKLTDAEKSATFVCKPAKVVGNISDSSPFKGNFGEEFKEDWETPPTDLGEAKLWTVCQDGETDEVLATTVPIELGGEKQQFLIMTTNEAIDKSVQDCDAGLKGFVLMLEMDEAYDVTDEEHLIGRGDGGKGVDLGDEAWFDAYAKDIKIKWFFTLDDVKGTNSPSLLVNIDAANIKDMDENLNGPEHVAAYKKYTED